MPLEQFGAELLALYEPPLKATPTRHKIRQILGRVRALPGVATTDDLNPATVAAWVRDMMRRGLSRVTIDSYLAGLRSACTYAVVRGYIDSNPVESKKHWLPHNYEERPAPPAPEALAQADVDRLMLHLIQGSGTWEGQRMLALVATVLLAGLRRNEALLLKREDCELDRAILRVARCAWERRRRHAPPRLVAILADWLPRTGCEYVFPGVLRSGPWTGGPPGKKPLCRLREVGRVLGIGDLSFERLREFHASRGGAVALGPACDSAAVPDRAHTEPTAPRPGPRPRPPAPGGWRVVELDEATRTASIRGHRLPSPMTQRQFNIVTAMIRARGAGKVLLAEAEIEAGSGHANPGRTLRELRAIPAWSGVLIFPGRNRRRGYGLAES